MYSFKKYYSDRINEAGGLEEYISLKKKEKFPLFAQIKSSPAKIIVEAGCGSGINLIILSREGYKCIGIDKDSQVVAFSRGLAKKSNAKIKYLVQDFTKTNVTADVIFSHGVLEHYADNKIIDYVNSQLKIAPKVVISVPGDYFNKSQAIEGNERFLSQKKWESILVKSSGKLVNSFAYMSLNPSLHAKLKFILTKITFGYLPRKKPYLCFVVVRRNALHY